MQEEATKISFPPKSSLLDISRLNKGLILIAYCTEKLYLRFIGDQNLIGKYPLYIN